MSQDENTVNHLMEISRRIGEMAGRVESLSSEITGLKGELKELKDAVSKIQKQSQAVTGGLRTAAFIIGMLGGAAGGKIAHFLGFFNSTPGPHN